MMKILCDTHILIWFLTGDDRLSVKARTIIENEENEIYSCGGFNTPTLCVVTKGIKADCNHLMRTTTPTLASGLLIFLLYLYGKLA